MNVEELVNQAKTSLEDYEGQGGRITKKVVFDIVNHYNEMGHVGLDKKTIKQIALELHSTMTQYNEIKIYEALLEAFGEPIGKTVATVGAADNGPQGKALWNDPPKKDRQWADPDVVNEMGDFTFGKRMAIPKEFVQPKYHREGFIDNLDEFKAEFVLTPTAQQKAQRAVGPDWRDYKPSALLKVIGAVTESIVCSECNMMGEMDGTPACECNDGMMETELDEVTPPSKEKMVKALKKKPGVKNPWAIAWSTYDKEHGKNPNTKA